MMSVVSQAVTLEILIIGVFDDCKDSSELIPRNISETNKNVQVEKQILSHKLPNIFLSNIQSFGKSSKTDKTVETETILKLNNIDISIFCETWLTDETKDFLPFHDYTKYHLIRKNVLRSSGSVSVFVKNVLKSKQMEINVPTHLECLWVSVKPDWMPRKFSIIIICAIYYPGSNSIYAPLKDDLITSITQNLKFKYANPLFILAGDFNDLAVDEICSACKLHQVVKTKTRKNATLDLILTNSDNDYYTEPKSLPKIGNGDHFCILYEPKSYEKPKIETNKVLMRKYPKSAVLDFGYWLTRANWETQYEMNEVDEKIEYFCTTTWEKIDQYFPLKPFKIVNTDKEWMTPHIKQLITQRQKAHHNGNVDLRDHLASKVQKEIRDAKVKFKTHQIGEFQNASPKDWYRHVNKIVNSGKNKIINTSNIPELSNKNYGEVSKVVNCYFAKICRKYPPFTLDIPVNEDQYERPLKKCSELQTYNMIKKFSKKALGPGDFPKKVLKEFAVELAAPYTDIINCSLKTRVFPETYKKAEITPIPKCNPPRSLSDLRPISKTCLGAKMIETMMIAELDIDTKSKLDSDQYGNRKGCSTTHYLINLTDEAYMSTDKGKATTAVTIDYSKAFDYVDHEVLIKKLIKLNVRVSIIKLIVSFLQNRSHCTKFSNQISEFETITCGVPQGTVGGPKLFVILIDGAKCDIVSSFKFVDDKTLSYSYSGNPTDVLQTALAIEDRETAKDKMLINPDKCNAITWNFSQNNTPPQNLILNGNIIPSVSKIKLLGVIITDDLKWSENTLHVCSKVNRKLFILCLLKQFGFTREELVIAWTTIIRPVTEYAAPLWHSGLTDSDIYKLERLQKRALGIILGVTYLENKRYYRFNYQLLSYECVLEKLGLISLSERRNFLTNNFAIQTLKKGIHADMFKEKESVILTRNSKKLLERQCKTDRHYKSAIPHMLRFLNGAIT